MKKLPKIKKMNENFWDDYGHPSDSKSFLARAKLLTVCHGQSKESKFYERHDEIIKYPDTRLPNDIIYRKLYDSHLSKKGKK